MLPRVQKEALEAFRNEIEALTGDALLERQFQFDQLPDAVEGERDLRFLQKTMLEAQLLREFGFDYMKVFKEYLERRPDAPMP